MRKLKIFNENYPQNLLDDISGGWEETLPTDIAESVEYVLGSFPYLEACIIRDLYCEDMSIEDIAEKENITPDKVRKLHELALKRFNLEENRKYLIHGVKGVTAIAMEKAVCSSFKALISYLDEIYGGSADEYSRVLTFCRKTVHMDL